MIRTPKELAKIGIYTDKRSIHRARGMTLMETVLYSTQHKVNVYAPLIHQDSFLGRDLILSNQRGTVSGFSEWEIEELKKI